MGKSDLQVSIVPEPGVVLVRLVGEAHFDFDGGDAYVQKITSFKAKNVIVDAAALTFLSSVGMNFLIHLRRAVIAAGGTVKLAGLQPLIAEALQNAHILALFQTFPSVAAAKAQQH